MIRRVTLFRWRWWLFMQRVCDVIGPPLDAVIIRIPLVRDYVGACTILHGVTFRGDITTFDLDGGHIA